MVIDPMRLADIRNQAEAMRRSPSTGDDGDMLATLLIDLVDAIDPTVADLCEPKLAVKNGDQS